MKKLLAICCLAVALCLSTRAKAQLVINNGGIINIQGGSTTANMAFVVLNNPPAAPISMTNTVSAQGIMMEAEYAKLKYNIDQATTAITVPYLSWNLERFPLTVYNITAGTHSGSNTGAIQFSSRPAGLTSGLRGAGWDNSSYQPSQVANMCYQTCPGSNNSANSVDRFWIIEPIYYATRPAVTLDFTYINAEAATNAGNIASLAGTLGAQRFDTTANQTWNGFSPAGTDNTGASTGTVTGVVVSSSDFFPDWTLNNQTTPLPITLLDFNGNCTGGRPVIKWSTAFEQNSHHFDLERSLDGIYFEKVATVPAKGNSNGTSHYSYADAADNAGSFVYYRLTQTDKNGSTQKFGIISVTNCDSKISEGANVFSPDNQSVIVNFFAAESQTIQINAYDMTGRQILAETRYAETGDNSFKLTAPLAQGIYIFEIKGINSSVVKKIFIENKN